MYLKTQGLVLREVAYKDTDKLLTVLTRDYGKMTLKARGVRRSGSPLKASCQLLACGEFTIFEYRGVERLVGIDLSREAVALARWAGEDLPQCQFLWGSVEKLMELPDTSFDGIVLSNILDNLKPTDSRAVLQETIRLLQPEGKVLIKLNPYLTREQIEAWGVRTIEGDLLDDGLLLWNRTTEAWQEELQRDFRTVRFEDVYFSEYDQHNRMFLCEALQNANK